MNATAHAAGRGRRRGDCRGDGGVGAHIPGQEVESRAVAHPHSCWHKSQAWPQLDLEGEASILAKTRRGPSKVAASD